MVRSVCVATAALGLALFGCGDDGGPGDDPEVTEDELVAALFEPDRVLDIVIDVDPADWDALRTETRSILDVVGSSCLTAAPESPFNFVSATVTIDGVTVENVGVRKKGFFGSLDETRPSLKINFDEYVQGQRFTGLERMTLNNNKSDLSQVKQCLGYKLFADAGIYAPRCNFAKVTVNGEELGVYTHVESMKKQFLRRFFEDDEGRFYEGALSDFRDGWVETFQVKTNEELVTDKNDLYALVDAVEAADDVALGQIESMVDVDYFMTFWAMEVLTGHGDGYARNTNNFYLYEDPASGKYYFFPWGIDSLFVPAEAQLPWEDAVPAVSVWAEGALARRLYNISSTRADYFAALEEVLTRVWSETEILAEIDRMSDLIRPHVTGKITEVDDARAALEDFIETRRAGIEAALAGPEPDLGTTLRDPWCIEQIGEVSGTFDTTWGSLDVEDLSQAGAATLDLTMNEVLATLDQVGATSGLDEEGKPGVRFIGVAGNVITLVHFAVDPSVFTPQTSVSLDWIDATGVVVELVLPVAPEDPPAEPKFIGMIGEGVLEIDEAGTNPGDPVIGQVSGIVYEPLF